MKEELIQQLLDVIVDPKLRNLETRQDIITKTVDGLDEWADGVGDLVSAIWDAFKPQFNRLKKELALSLKDGYDNLVEVGFEHDDAIEIVIAMAGKTISVK